MYQADVFLNPDFQGPGICDTIFMKNTGRAAVRREKSYGCDISE